MAKQVKEKGERSFRAEYGGPYEVSTSVRSPRYSGLLCCLGAWNYVPPRDYFDEDFNPLDDWEDLNK
jgi:hypothetical protein